MKNIMLSPHFSLLEFIESPTAKKHGIENYPPDEAIESLRQLCIHTLEPLRKEIGLPMIIMIAQACGKYKAVTHADALTVA